MKERSELDRHLLEFMQILRQGGIGVSISEILDALNGLSLIGLEDKRRVEGVLQATLVKSPQQISWFREAFRVFFAQPEQQKAWQLEAQERSQHWEEKMARSRRELTFQGRELELTEEQRITYMQLPEEERERLLKFLEKSEQGIKNGIPLDHSFYPVVERILRGSLDYWRRRFDEELPLTPPGLSGILFEVERALREQEIKYLARDLKDIPADEWPEVNRLIRRLSQRLAAEVSCRYRVAKNRGGLDMRRTLRENLRYGGVFLDRRYRARPLSRPKFVLLCDLSGSMIKYTEFILQFIYGLSSVLKGIETFAFADKLVDLTDKLRSGKSIREMLSNVLPEVSREWGGGTNLAVSLRTLLQDHPFTLSRRTVLIVVSDTQTLDGEEAASLIKGIKTKVREIIWLNTLPSKRWRETKTVGYFRPHCQMFECNTLGQLNQILSARL